MGAVYLARRVLLGDDVAIKVILADQEGPAPLERFVRESRACAQLRHPNIVSILDYNADDPQRPFLVMELLSGPSLKDELAEKRRFPVAELQRIIPVAARGDVVRRTPRMLAMLAILAMLAMITCALRRSAP